MTGSYFRGDAAAILSPEDEARFATVTYTYYEQLNGYQYLEVAGHRLLVLLRQLPGGHPRGAGPRRSRRSCAHPQRQLQRELRATARTQR